MIDRTRRLGTLVGALTLAAAAACSGGGDAAGGTAADREVTEP